MAIGYSQQQKEFLAKRPADVIQYDTVEFFHPDFGYIRLLANQFSDQVFEGVSYQAASMQLPKVTSQSTDDTRAGSVIFGRIGVIVRQKLLQITPLGAIKYPIKATLRQFQSGVKTYERRLYVGRDGVSIGVDNAEFRLSVDNPAKLANEGAFYDPSVFLGLQTS
ncbi:MAG: hypothetical protein COA43_14715 [Robiginitomaculum sp.]|nr:MAG: hypothetical protein COA43_14715 [Robiginitomaculum sp.]